MSKKILKFSMLPAVLALTFLSFTTKDVSSIYEPLPLENSVVEVEDAIQVTVDTLNLNYVLTKNDFTGFKAAVGFKESQGHYNKVNAYGYLGKYQFSQGTLAMIGVYNINNFLNNPKLQERAFYANASRNKWVLRRDIKKYVGKTIDGVKITESGILAAAHLGGPGSVKKFLRSGGVRSISDAFGTSIKHYMQQFGGYDVSFVKENRRAKVKMN